MLLSSSTHDVLGILPDYGKEQIDKSFWRVKFFEKYHFEEGGMKKIILRWISW
jgi:hypothetical protein